MKKFITGLLALCLVPLGVNAETKTVSTEAELKNALADSNVTEITLGADIETQGKVNINRDVTIDGKGHNITYTGKFYNTANPDGIDDNTVWSSKSTDGTKGAVYVLQVYQSKVTIKDITLAGGNRGLAVNGGYATLEGVVNFKDNGFQDIELSLGANVTENPTLEFGYAAKVNSDKDNLIVVQGSRTHDADAQVIVNGEPTTYHAEKDTAEANVTLAEMKEALRTVTLTFVAEGESESIEVPYGFAFTQEQVDELINTLREELKVEGYTIDDFYQDEALTVKYDLTNPITEDTTVYMKLVKLEDTTAPAPQEVKNAKTGDMNLIMVLSLLGVAGAAVVVTGKKVFLSNNI